MSYRNNALLEDVWRTWVQFPLAPPPPRVAQFGSALALGARGPEFKSQYADHFYWGIAKLVKARDFDSRIVGSSPATPASMVH